MILPGATGAGRASNQYPPERSSGVNSIQYPETQPAAALAGLVTATAAASGTPISEATVTGTPVSDATPAVTAAATIPPTLGTGTPSSTPPTSEATPTATPGSTGTPGVTDISNWPQLGGSFTTPSNAAYVKVELRTQMTSGWLTFDDITLQGGAERVYYNAGGTRVAMRLNGALKWLLEVVVGRPPGQHAQGGQPRWHPRYPHPALQTLG